MMGERGSSQGEGVIWESKTHGRPPISPGRGMEKPFSRTASFLHGPKFPSSKVGQKFLPENFSQKFPALDLSQNFYGGEDW
jgi:hypothetical protein